MLLIIVLFIIILAVGPWYPYSRGWGYTPFSVLFFIMLLFVLLYLLR